MVSNSQIAPQSSCRIALLTPYDGGNLGDAAIQDSLIANIRARLPEAQFSAISLSGESFVAQHGVESAFALCATDRAFYGMARQTLAERLAQRKSVEDDSAQDTIHNAAGETDDARKSEPVDAPFLTMVRNLARTTFREIRHFGRGYHFLRSQDLLIVSGGGQFDEEWGGPWGHPYALFKWTALAKLAGIPCAIPSVGTGRAKSKTGRWLMSAALRMSEYRSYRDKNSKAVAAGLQRRAANDSIVPDLAFTIPASEFQPNKKMRALAQGRKVIAISPIAYAKPGNWPQQDRAAYDRYAGEMARAISQLIARGYFLTIVCSSLGDDDRVIPEILDRVDANVKNKFPEQLYIPPIATWKDLAASLSESDILIASRLHSIILGFVTGVPSIAISFSPKVDWAMEDFGQSGYRLDIRNFTAEDLIAAVEHIELNRIQVVEQIHSHRRDLLPACELQYDALAALARAKSETRSHSISESVNHAS